MNTADTPSPAGRDRWLLLGSAGFMVALDATAVVAAFPEFRRDFGGVAPATLSWVLNAYTLLYAALLIPMGRWADAHGRRQAFLGGLALFTLASFACGVAPDAATLITARVVQAVGAAMVSPAALALLLAATPGGKRGIAVSIWGAVTALAAAVGPAGGSWLIDVFSWRAIFWINVPIGVVVLWRAARLLDERAPTAGSQRPDWPGAALIAAGVSATIAACVRLETPAQRDATTWLTLATGIALLAASVGWARKRPGGTLDLTLFRDRNYAHANAATLVFGAAFGLMFFAFFVFTTGVWGYSQTRAGLAATVGPLTVVPFALLAGRFAARHGHRAPLVIGGLLYAASQTWYALRLGAEPNYLGAWLPGQLASGAAIGLVLPSLGAAAVAGLPAGALAAGNAMNTAVRQLGAVIGVAVGATLVGEAGAELPAFQRIYGMLAGAGVLTALLSLAIDTRPRAAAVPAMAAAVPG